MSYKLQKWVYFDKTSGAIIVGKHEYFTRFSYLKFASIL